jgi:AraC-like DNA-binding protein
MENKMLECSFEFLSGGGRERSTYFDFHSHQAYELVYYLRGSGSTTIHGVKYEYFPNSFSITEPNHMHDEYHCEDTYVIYVVFTHRGDITVLTDGIFYDSIGNTVRHILEEMKKEYYTQSSHYRLKLDLLTQQMIIELARIAEKSRFSDNLSMAVKYLNENYTDRIDMKILAERVGYSYNQFRRIIKKHTGLSPINYIIRKRIENAQYLLKCTSLPISHISQECGFASDSQFCSMFKKVVRQTPKSYRKVSLSVDIEKE